jgi:hypothetical protein
VQPRRSGRALWHWPTSRHGDGKSVVGLKLGHSPWILAAGRIFVRESGWHCGSRLRQAHGFSATQNSGVATNCLGQSRTRSGAVDIQRHAGRAAVAGGGCVFGVQESGVQALRDLEPGANFTFGCGTRSRRAAADDRRHSHTIPPEPALVAILPSLERAGRRYREALGIIVT